MKLMAMQYCGEFDNWGAVMSVSSELLCSFELLKPLDSSALKSHIKKGRNKRQNMLNSPVSAVLAIKMAENLTIYSLLRCLLKAFDDIFFSHEPSDESKRTLCKSLLCDWRLMTK